MTTEFQPNVVLSVYSTFAWVQPIGDGLTITQANGLYLQKTVPDTATALETFSAGINTNSITTGASRSTAINIGTGNNGTVAADININTGSFSAGTTAINTGAGCTGNIDIGSNTNTCRIYSSTTQVETLKTDTITSTGTGTNDLTITSTTGAFNIENSKTLGAININTQNTGVNLSINNITGRTQPINLGGGNNGTSNAEVRINHGNNSAGATKINSGSGHTGDITIGTSTNNCTINSGTTSTQILTPTIINPQDLSALDIANITYSLFGGASAVNIGKNMTSGNINVLSSGTATFNVNGAGLLTNNINATDPSAPMNIGVGYTSEGNNIEIGTNKIAGKINMLPALSGTAVLQVNGAGIRAGDISSITNTTDINITGEQTSGWTYIADGVARTGRVYIAARTAAPVYIASDAVAGGSVTIGSTDITTKLSGNLIQQVVPLGSGVITNVMGNASTDAGITTTFNRKYIAPGGAGVGSPINCYTITSPLTYTCEYFEIVVSGCNDGPGGYSYKGCFSLNHLFIGTPGNTVIPSSVTTLFSYGGTPVIGLTAVLGVVTLSVNTIGISAPPGGISTSQRFVTTLTGFPTLTLFNALSGYSVTAI